MTSISVSPLLSDRSAGQPPTVADVRSLTQYGEPYTGTHGSNPRFVSRLRLETFAGQPPVADVRSLTHYGEPYDGNTRFMRSTLFVMAVRASYGEAGLLHGIDYMPPKVRRFEKLTLGRRVLGRMDVESACLHTLIGLCILRLASVRFFFLGFLCRFEVSACAGFCTL